MVGESRADGLEAQAAGGNKSKLQQVVAICIYQPGVWSLRKSPGHSLFRASSVKSSLNHRERQGGGQVANGRCYENENRHYKRRES